MVKKFTKRVEWCPLGYTHFAHECEKTKCKEHDAERLAHSKKIEDERQVMFSQGFDYIYLHELKKWIWVHEDILSRWVRE